MARRYVNPNRDTPDPPADPGRMFAWYARAAGEAGDPVLASALYTASLRARQLAAQQAAAAGVTPGTDETAPVWAWEQDAEGPGK
jgi:hypothetical protein